MTQCWCSVWRMWWMDAHYMYWIRVQQLIRFSNILLSNSRYCVYSLYIITMQVTNICHPGYSLMQIIIMVVLIWFCYQDQIFSKNKILLKWKNWSRRLEVSGPNFSVEDQIFKTNWSGGPKFSVKKLVQGPKFSGPKFQWQAKPYFKVGF